ncbi:GDSL esterase/lipase [Rhynchospora pubera]|uniref:GDSL esterase/lipase n=1 Tax=Rhynchospora pubera TaxID=906938 RepID=A0AAV8EL54_9POAL|nr:GDSL esterase/lipase [Rhynchospora pubera]
MASRHLPFSLHIPTLILLLALSKTGNCCFTHIFCFGDSISDTGNFLKSIGNRYDPVRNLPYGETYFRRPTGRFCDGRIILDFIAEAYGLPFVPAYLSGKNSEDFLHGVNFAVGGATALNNSFFESKGIEADWTDYSLGTQLQWFKKLLPKILEKPGCGSDVMSNALFVVGEIGGNDYNHPLLNGLSLDEVRTFVPDVISTISLTIHELIGRGAKTLLVPNNFPIGCVPVYLTIFQSKKKDDYDPETGCIKRLNEFSQYHNAKLLEELEKLRLLYPDVAIIYADYYEASITIFRNPKEFGFTYPFMACCGAEGPYNYSSFATCGNRGSTVCSDPSKYGSWDGLHLTEAAYKVISHGVLQGNYSYPPLSNACSDIMHDSANLLVPPTQCSG